MKVKSGRMIFFVLIFMLSVGFTGCTSFSTPKPPSINNPPENRLATTEFIENETPIATADTDVQNSTPVPTSVPTPFLTIDSQINRLPAGFYLVFYDLKKGTLEALSFQIKLTTLATGNEIFKHSTNSIYALVGHKLINLQTRENTLVTDLDESEHCQISSISRAGNMLAAVCEKGGLKIFPVGGEWQTVNPEFKLFPLQVQPQLSPDDEQVAFCMNDPEDEGFSKLYRINLEACTSEGACEPKLINSSCDDSLIAWSPDAKMLAVSEQHQGIRLYDFVFGTKTEILTAEQTLQMNEMAWSPDGKQIAFTRPQGTEKKPTTSIYLVNIPRAEPRLFYTSENPIKLVGWLNIITAFKPNGRYEVLPSENQYWLKASPSQTAFNMKLFIAGEKVRVLEKSEVVDGEKWWQVRVGDFSGWVVENNLHFEDDWAYGLGSPVFASGRILIVKLSGKDLRLREMPSLNGAVKRYLQPGMKLKIVDGPAVVDNYNWWLVEIEESKIYGWVAEEALWYAAGR